MKSIATIWIGGSLSILSAAELTISIPAHALCVGICPTAPVRRVYTPPYVYRRPVIVAPSRVVAPAPGPGIIRTTCSRDSGNINAFFRPNYASSVVANLPIGQQVPIVSFINANRESWGLINLGGTNGYIPSINLC